MWNLSEIQRLLVEFYGFFVGLVLGAGPYGEPLRAVYHIVAWLIVFLPAILIAWAVRDKIRSIKAQEAAPVFWTKRILWFPVLIMLIIPIPSRFVMHWIYSDPYLVHLNPHARQQLFFHAKLPLLNWLIYGLARSGMMVAGHIADPWEGLIIKDATKTCYYPPGKVWKNEFQKIIAEKIDDKKMSEILQKIDPKQFQRYFDLFEQDFEDFCRLTVRRGAFLTDIRNSSYELRFLGVIAFQNAHLHRNRMKEDVLDGYAALLASLLAAIDPKYMPASCNPRLGAVLNADCIYTAYERQILEQGKSDQAPYVILSKAHKEGFFSRAKGWIVTKVTGAAHAVGNAAKKAKDAVANAAESAIKWPVVKAGEIIGIRKGAIKMDSLFVYATSISFMGFMLYYWVVCLLTIIRTYFFLLWKVPFSEAHGDEFLRLAKQIIAIFFVPGFALLGFFLVVALRTAILEVVIPLAGKIMSMETFLGFMGAFWGQLILSLTTVMIFAAIIFQVGTIPLKIASRMDEGVVGQEGPQIKPSVPVVERYGVQ